MYFIVCQKELWRDSTKVRLLNSLSDFRNYIRENFIIPSEADKYDPDYC